MKENTLEAKKEISKLHFLVHPGYMAKVHRGGNDNKDYKELLKKYVEKAKKIAQGELMVIFAPAANQYFVEQVRKDSELYVACIKQIKSILGNRVIVLSSQSEIWEENKDKIWKKIKNTAETRGFVFGKGLTFDAYGEYMDYCVEAVSENMHAAAKLGRANPVNVHVDLTDFSIPYEREYLLHPPNPAIKKDYTGISDDF
jgi:hypothetical protein